MKENIIQIKNLDFSYTNKTKILNNININIKRNSIHAIFGPNGSGKTTLLKCINNIINNYTGNIFIEGKNSMDMSYKEIAKSISYVPQERTTIFQYTVFEMILMGRNIYVNSILSSDEDKEKTLEVLNVLGIYHLKDKIYSNLSGGQKQLVLIARALVQETDIIILDEPTSALDFRNKVIILNKLNILKNEGKTIIICLHDPNDIIYSCDNVSVLNKGGKLFSSGKVKDIFNQKLFDDLYGNVAKFFNGYIFPK